MDELFIFDKDKPQYTKLQLIIAGFYQLIISQIITIIICKVLQIDIKQNVVNHKDNITKKWKESGLGVSSIILSEILGTIVYTSFAEEFVYKLFFMKYVLVKGLNINVYLSNFIQALLFSITHYINIINIKQDRNYTMVQMISCFVSGFVGGFFYLYFNSLIPSVIAHMTNNSFAVIDEIITYVKNK